MVGKRSRSNAQNRVLTSLSHALYLALRSRSKVGVKVKGQGQGRGQGQRSRSRSLVKAKGQGRISGTQRSILGARLCRVQQRAIRVITSLRCLSVSL